MKRLVWIRLFSGLVLFVASMGPASAYLVDQNTYPPPSYFSFVPPILGGSYTDPVFGTTVKRISNAPGTFNSAAGSGNLTFIINEYSTMSPFNSDNSRLLLLHQSYFALYDGQGNFIKDLPFQVHASSEPRWSRQDPNVIYFINGNQLKQYNAASDSIFVIRTFSQYSRISGKGESDICFDGDHFVLVGDNREIFVYEISSNRMGPVLNTSGLGGFDQVYITPNDNVLVGWLATGAGRFRGVEMYDRNMNFLRQVARAGGHMDVTRDVNGDEVLLVVNAADPDPDCGENTVVKISLSDGRQTCVISFDWSLAVHVSAPDNSEWAFISTYAPNDPSPYTGGWKQHTNEILQVKMDGSEVRRLAHHRSRPFNGYNYTPRVSVSRDGTKLVYSSNFGLQGILGYPGEYSDVYFIELPSSGSSGGSSGGSGGSSGGSSSGSGNSSGSSGGSTGGSSGGTATASRVEQDSSSVQYSGTWYTNRNSAHSGGTAALSVSRGDYVTFSFTGTGVKWIAYRDEWSGIAKVYIDGVLKATVDTYSSPAKGQAVVFSTNGLASGSHAITVEVTGTRSLSSAGSWVWVDAFEVVSN